MHKRDSVTSPIQNSTGSEAPLIQITLPPPLPRRPDRPTQSNIPNEKAQRNLLKKLTAEHLRSGMLAPPLSMEELRRSSLQILAQAGLDSDYQDYVAVLVNNESWRTTMAAIPYEKRLLLIPKCLRVEEKCPAPFDDFGLLCKECGLCSIQDLTVEAERLGYSVLVAEGSAIVRQMIETGRIEAIVGVSCLNVLEKCFPHMEAAAIPGVSIPLLQDDCINTNVDLDWVWDVIHLTSADRSYRMDLDALREEVHSWFAPEALSRLMGPSHGHVDAVAREWLGRSGKRWRPFLAVCAYLALKEEEAISDAVRQLAIAVECFHKASLIHDDIEDDDHLRYSQSTLHVEQGLPVALNAGDFLIGEGFRLLHELDFDPQAKLGMLGSASRGLVTLSRGQGEELSWARSPRPMSSMEVLRIFKQKTVPAFQIALDLGARAAGAAPEVRRILDEFSDSVGLAYQIRDDLEDFSTDDDGNGGAVEMRPTLPMAIALKRIRSADDAALVESLWRGQSSFTNAAERVRSLLHENGVVAKAEELRDAYKEQAVRTLQSLENPTLKGMLRRVVGKVFGEQLIESYCREFEARNAASRQAGASAAS